MTAPTPFDDWLALSRDPQSSDQANLYFLGQFDRRITFYSQQVRALRLADALDRSGLLLPEHNVAVVGAGAAGVTAALAIALLGNDVTLYDPASKVLHLQSASSRLLHPHIYEWPRLGSLEDQAGLPIFNWSANTGETVCNGLQQAFEAAKTRLTKLKFAQSRQLESVERIGSEWKLWLKTETKVEPKIFQHVVLAMGFGEERPCGVSVPTDYWKPSGIGTGAVEPQSGTTYLVSGNGDGGLTEVLGLLVSNFDHVAFTRRFLQMFSGDVLRKASELVFRGTAIGADIEPALRQHLLPLLEERDVLGRLKPMLRNDRQITFNSSGPHFEASKAAQLNQCMVFAVLEAAATKLIHVRRSTGKITDVANSTGGMRVVGICSGGQEVDTIFKHVILRHGPDGESRYSPAETLYTGYRTYIKGLFTVRPELAEPPILDPEIYERFEARAVDQLHDEVERPNLLARIMQRQTTIVLSIDKAANILTEKGKWTFAYVADQCERLPEMITLQLGVEAPQLPWAKDLVGLARASNGRIQLKADASVYSGWQAFGSSISQSQTIPSFYVPRDLELSDVTAYVDASLLRLLNTRMTQTIESGSCPSLGKINAELLAEIEVTWSQWRTVLNVEVSLRTTFLRWLANVDPRDSRSWDGDHGKLDDLSSALVLILATHSGEALTPASLPRGNLAFWTNALALGSGCRTIGGQLIADWTKPEQWGVDALIVSTTSEIMISSSPAGTLMDGGSGGKGLLRARQVQPAVIQNSHLWRRSLAATLTVWRDEVAKEFAEFRKRQDDTIGEVSE